MRNFIFPILCLAWKDIALELRTKETTTSLVVFAVLSVVTFNFAFESSSTLTELIVPGVMWVTFIFAGILGFNRSFVLEKDKGSLEGLLLMPVSRDVIYFGKFLSIFTFMIVVETLLLPVFAIIYDFPLMNPKLFLVAALATLGFTGVGTLFSAIAVNTRSREVMLPVLVLPVVMPVIIAAVVATRNILNGASWGEIGHWCQLLVAFDVIFLVLPSFVFGAILEE